MLIRPLALLLLLGSSSAAYPQSCDVQLSLLESASDGFGSVVEVDLWVDALSATSTCMYEGGFGAESYMKWQAAWGELYNKYESMRSAEACAVTVGLFSVSDGSYSQSLIENVYDAYIVGRIEQYCGKQYLSVPVIKSAVDAGIERYGCDGMAESIRIKHEEACLH